MKKGCCAPRRDVARLDFFRGAVGGWGRARPNGGGARPRAREPSPSYSYYVVEGLDSIITAEVIARWLHDAAPPELLRRIASLTARGAYPADPVLRDRVRHLRARRAAWDVYVGAAASVGLLDADVAGRLKSAEPEQFRSAMAECETAWLLAGRLGVPLEPRPAGRKTRQLELKATFGGLTFSVEVKAPALKGGPIEGGVVPPAAELGKALDEANSQFSKEGANLLVLVPDRAAAAGTMRWKLMTQFYGEPVVVWDVDRSTGRGVLGPGRADFRPNGKLLKRWPTEPRFTRTSAVLCIEERVATRYPNPWDPEHWRRSLSLDEFEQMRRRFWGPTNEAWIEHSVQVLHNPNTPYPLPQNVFGDLPQFVADADQMVWLDDRLPLD
jgi:hypothetical protein